MAGAESESTTRRAPIEEVLATDEAQRLLETGQQAGKLDADEITLALDELGLDAAQLDEFYAALDEAQIEVVQAGDEAEPEPEPANVGPARSRPTRSSSS